MAAPGSALVVRRAPTGSEVGLVTLGTARAEFEAFFDRHYRDLDRLAYLLTRDPAEADELSSDVLLATWRQWQRVRGRDDPFAYVRRIMVNMAASRVRRLTRERRRHALFHRDAGESLSGPDVAAVVDVRTALLELPVRRRACVVLRHAFDLPEHEVAAILAVSIGTVKSQTSKGMAQLQRLLTTEAAEWVT